MPVVGQDGTTAGVEQRVIFENSNSRRDRIEAAAASLEYCVACIERFREARAITCAIIGAELLAGDDAKLLLVNTAKRSAMDGDRERAFGFRRGRVRCND